MPDIAHGLPGIKGAQATAIAHEPVDNVFYRIEMCGELHRSQ